MKSNAGRVLGEDAGLHGPDTGFIGGREKCVQQRSADAMALVVGGDVNAVFDHA